MRVLTLNTAEDTHHHREAVDGLPCGNRYRTACLRKIGRFFSDIVHLGLDPVTYCKSHNSISTNLSFAGSVVRSVVIRRVTE